MIVFGKNTTGIFGYHFVLLLNLENIYMGLFTLCYFTTF